MYNSSKGGFYKVEKEEGNEKKKIEGIKEEEEI